MSCVMCESDGVQLRPAVDVLIVPYSVRPHAIRQFGLIKYSTQIIRTSGYLNFIEACIYSKAAFFGQSD